MFDLVAVDVGETFAVGGEGVQGGAWAGVGRIEILLTKDRVNVNGGSAGGRVLNLLAREKNAWEVGKKARSQSFETASQSLKSGSLWKEKNPEKRGSSEWKVGSCGNGNILEHGGGQ